MAVLSAEIVGNKMLNKLFNLYKCNTQKTPLEDFTTEVLAGVLNTDQDLLDEFVNNLLGIMGSKYTVETQKSEKNSVIDMVFENTDTIIFMENKIYSGEGYGQLKKYANILTTHSKKINI